MRLGVFLVVIVGTLAFLFLNRTGDGTASAQVLSTLRTGDYHSLAISPSDPKTVFFGHHGGIKKSTDGGKTWQDLPINQDAMGMVISPKEPEVMYIAGHDVYAKSTDGGKTWQADRPALPGTDIHAFAMSPSDPKHLYAYVVEANSLFESRDGGSSWQPLPGEAPQGIMGLGIAAGDPETILAATMRQGVMRSTDGGRTWSSGGGSLPGGSMSFATSPGSPGLVYSASSSGVYRSDDAGATWRPAGLEGVRVMTVAAAPTDPKIIQAVDDKGRVYRSTDGGASWTGE
ncbi:MAG: hypothetical protein M3Q29_25250 [Chloroflexota bacterium]|nr:hypothetical protein [Chloroflexota bacterium]